MKRFKKILRCFWQGLINTVMHDGIEHAGYLAFLGLLALFPFLVFLVALIGVFGQGFVGADTVTMMFNRLPTDVIRAIEPRIVEIVSGPPQGLLTIAIIGTIWTASSAVEGLRTTLNRAYHVHTPPTYLLRRSLSILQLLLFAFVLLIGMLVLVTMPVILHQVENFLGLTLSQNEELVKEFIYIGTLALLYGAVCAIYYSLPNIKQHFISVAPGAAIVVLLWIFAGKLLTYYINDFTQFTLVYGSLGGIIAALLFFYLCNIIFIYGAEVNYLISRVYGMQIEEKDETPAPPPPADQPPSSTTT